MRTITKINIIVWCIALAALTAVITMTVIKRHRTYSVTVNEQTYTVTNVSTSSRSGTITCTDIKTGKHMIFNGPITLTEK